MRNTLSIFLLSIALLFVISAKAQVVTDSLPAKPVDTALRIINYIPFFNQHVDSSLSYQFLINKPQGDYYWYLKNPPAGLKINKDNGLLSFKADKSYFLSGKLRYDYPYKVNLGLQSLHDAIEKLDTFFTLIFYNTEIIPSRVKPTVASPLLTEEGELVSFKVQCEDGSFPIETILFSSSIPIKDFSMPQKCGDDFSWTPPFDFVKDNDPDKAETVSLVFIGSNKFKVKDTAIIKLTVRDALNYPMATETYNTVVKNIRTYVLQLKYSFLQLDKRLKKTKGFRTGFDLTSASTALTGTILNTTASSTSTQKAGKILPSVGVALVPIKEATAPNKTIEQNQASMVRASIKRLEYTLFDQSLVGDKDPAVIQKTNKLKEELRQSQMQLIDVPVDFGNTRTEEELNNYFNSPKVTKKYRLKKK